MTSTDAAKILDLPADTPPEQLEARFLELRRRLEDKIAKAPTPGLQAKYRESLEEITTAFETLTLAADSSALPIASKTAAVGSPLAATSPTRSAQAPALHSKPKSGGKEFLLVAVIAVVVLAAGGWFVMKTRAENAEKARLAVEQKAEADRKAEESRVAAEAKKKAEEDEKARLATAAKAEQERLEKLTAQVRVGFSESKLLWQQAERTERETQRELDDLKNSARSMRDLSAGQRRESELRLAAQADYQRWLTDYLARHPARRAEVRTEELLNARQIEAAAEALAQYQQALAGLAEEITARKPNPDDLFGSLVINSTPAGIAWELTDAFGQAATGTTPGAVQRTGIGPATVTFRRPGWEPYTVSAQVTARQEARAVFTYRPATLTVASNPAGAAVYLDNKLAGSSPLSLADLPVKAHEIEARLPGHKSRTEKVTLQPGETTAVNFDLPALTDQEFIAAFSTRWKGVWGGFLSGVGFQCRFTADSTRYSEWNTTGKYAANPPVTAELEVITRSPLSLNRVMMANGRKFVLGHFLEENGRLVYVAVAFSGGRSARVEMGRVSD
jgi:hypothetical protein